MLKNKTSLISGVYYSMREKTNLTLHPSVKDAALALAKSQGRSLSELVERLLEKEVDKKSAPTYAGTIKEEMVQTNESLGVVRTKVTYDGRVREYNKKP